MLVWSLIIHNLHRVNRHMDRFSQTHSLWIPCRGQQMEKHQRCTGRNSAIWHRDGHWWAAFSQTKLLAKATVPFLSLPLPETQSQQVCTISESPSTWHIYCPTLVIPWGLFHTNGRSCLMLQIFLNYLKQATSGLPLAMLPEAWH